MSLKARDVLKPGVALDLQEHISNKYLGDLEQNYRINSINVMKTG